MLHHVILLLHWVSKAALVTIIGLLAAAAAQAGEQLSGRDLQQLFPGRFQAMVPGGFIVSITARRDGSLLAEFLSKADTGRWSIKSGKLCIKFSKWLDGRTSCSIVVEEAGWYRSDDVMFRQADGFALVERQLNR
jgi:hypothetical protein